MSDVDVPVIDLESADVVAGLASAYETLGFARVVGHGIPRSLIAAVFDASERFHRLPLEDKLTIGVGARVRAEPERVVHDDARGRTR